MVLMSRGKLKRAVGQFTPYSWTSYQWGYSESLKRFSFVCIIVFIVSVGMHVTVALVAVYISSVSRYRLKYCASCNTVVVNMGGGGGANFSVRITNLTLAPDLID